MTVIARKPIFVMSASHSRIDVHTHYILDGLPIPCVMVGLIMYFMIPVKSSLQPLGILYRRLAECLLGMCYINQCVNTKWFMKQG